MKGVLLVNLGSPDSPTMFPIGCGTLLYVESSCRQDPKNQPRPIKKYGGKMVPR